MANFCSEPLRDSYTKPQTPLKVEEASEIILESVNKNPSK